MSISTNSTNGDFTPTEGEVNCESISLDNDGQSADGKVTDQQQQKEFREKCAKMEMDFKISTLELEKKLLEEKLKHKELKLEHFLISRNLPKWKRGKRKSPALLKKLKNFWHKWAVKWRSNRQCFVRKIDGLVAQQQKANGAVESVTITKSNNVLEEQQKKMDNFIVILKESTNELLNAVHPNIPQPIIAEKFFNPQQNCWDVNACHNDLKIVDSNKMIVHYQKNGNDNWSWRSVFAKHSILLGNGSTNIFYFEISVINLKSTIFFGFAFKNQAKLDDAIHLNIGTFARVSNGNFWINGTKREDAQYAYGCGDTVGFGVNLATQRLIFTKNGLLLDTADLSLSAALLFPFISLLSFDDKIEANFGPNFKCDLTAY